MDLTTFSTARLDHQREVELARRAEFARIQAERLLDSMGPYPTAGAVVPRLRFTLPMLHLRAAHR